jgi:hypothetical protein
MTDWVVPANLPSGFILLDVEAVNSSPTDLFEDVDIGDKALHVVIGRAKAAAADIKDIPGLEERLLYVTSGEFETLLPGCAASKHFTSLTVVPPAISSERAIASVCCGLRALGVLHYKVSPACVRGATVLLVCAGDSFSSSCVAFALRFGAEKILLHTRNADEYKYVTSAAPHDHASCTLVVLPPTEDVVNAAMIHTGGMGVDIVLDVSAIAEILGRPLNGAREAVRLSCDDGRATLVGASTAPLGEHSVGQYIPSLDTLVQCLGACSHLVTVRIPLEVDAPLLERLKVKNASFHCCHDLAWAATPRHAGKVLHMIDECLQYALRSELGTRPSQLVVAGDTDLPAVLRTTLGTQLAAVRGTTAAADELVIVHK